MLIYAETNPISSDLGACSPFSELTETFQSFGPTTLTHVLSAHRKGSAPRFQLTYHVESSPMTAQTSFRGARAAPGELCGQPARRQGTLSENTAAATP